ncbi:hypothetical protein DLM75_02140 [Leptospira stimsonii]|uniref:Uncharacterized protein n=1 Tax=Leptospira stimsonii TaxID=2202203 RepID=A0A396ZE62_9LEPT|nr:hypothetical protein DLM75_02140 [Leptospira stimsonii]
MLPRIFGRKFLWIIPFIFIFNCASHDFEPKSSSCAGKNKKRNECYEKLFSYCIFNNLSTDKPFTKECTSNSGIILLLSCSALFPECPSSSNSSSSSSSSSSK